MAIESPLSGAAGGDEDTALLSISIVDWSGEEKAQLLVRRKDTLIVGMEQIREQTGAAVRQQRLLMGETELTALMRWSDLPGLRNWAVVQLTIVEEEVCRAALSPLLTFSFALAFPALNNSPHYCPFPPCVLLLIFFYFRTISFFSFASGPSSMLLPTKLPSWFSSKPAGGANGGGMTTGAQPSPSPLGMVW